MLQHSILGAWLTLTQAGFPPASQSDLASPHAQDTVRAPAQDCVAAILDDFLAWCLENRAKRTYDGYVAHCTSFCQLFGDMPIDNLTSAHVTEWTRAHPQWNNQTQRTAITCIMRGFNWAVSNRGLKYNPIRGMEKPAGNARKTIIRDEEFNELMSFIDDSDPFADLLYCSWDIGCRPHEIKTLEARHLDLENHRAVIPTEEGKKGIARAIYFPTDRAMEIVSRLAKEHPTGPIFINTKGNPWTAYAVACRFGRLKEKVGKRFRQYDFRRTWITAKLKAGVDSHVVAKLSGHTTTAMIDKHYSQIADDPEYMLEQAKKTQKPK